MRNRACRAAAASGALAVLVALGAAAQVTPDPVLMPGAVPADPGGRPDQTRPDPVLMPGAVRADPAGRPDQTRPDPVLSPVPSDSPASPPVFPGRN